MTFFCFIFCRQKGNREGVSSKLQTHNLVYEYKEFDLYSRQLEKKSQYNVCNTSSFLVTTVNAVGSRLDADKTSFS